MDNYTPSAEELEEHFSALSDSVNLINLLVESNDKSDENKKIAKRNYEHIEIMLAKDFISADTRDKSSFENAVSAGKGFTE
jgi:hypothetical protein